MNQGGREFYIHQSQEAEKWHCLVTRKRLIIYTERESRRERREHFADRLCGLGYLRSSNTRYTKCTQAHDFNSDMMWHDYHCCLRSEHMRWQCLWKRRHPAPVDANVNFRSQRNQWIWWCLKRLHAQPLQLSFSKTKLSDQHPADITTSYDIHFKHSHSTPLPSSSQGSPNLKKLFDGKVLESAQQIASTKLTSIEFYKYFESVLSCYVCVWGSCAALGWNALAGVLVTVPSWHLLFFFNFQLQRVN